MTTTLPAEVFTVTAFEPANPTVPEVAVMFDAVMAATPAAAPGVTVAVIAPAVSIPNVTPLALEKTTVPELREFVPAEIAAPPPAPGAATEIDNPAVFMVAVAFVPAKTVPAYLLESWDRPAVVR
jgi:hypothetical protein